MTKKILTLIIIITIFGCKKSEKEKTEITKADLNDFYEQQGEGEIVEFNDSLVVFYNSSSFNAIRIGKCQEKNLIQIHHQSNLLIKTPLPIKKAILY